VIHNAPEADRSPKKDGYPVFSLEDCVAFSSGVKDLGGSRSPVAKSVLAKHFGVSQSTPSFFQKLGGARAYGIIDGRGAYSLTEQGRRYFYPTNESDKIQAGLSFLAKPAPFLVLLKRFDGEKLPAVPMLGNILHQEAGIVESWKDRLASIFVRSAHFLGIIDSGGFLRHDASVQSISRSSLEDVPRRETDVIPAHAAGEQQNESEGIVRFPRKPPPAAPGNTAWTFPFRGTYIRLETPEEMTNELWEKLNAYVQILKPTED
jgi:hypothetical protein